MQGNPRIIEVLNQALTDELTAINQYFAHAKMQENWGYLRLGKKTRAESIEEMTHAEVVIERILFFEGHPNLQRLGPVRVGETVPEQFRLDLELERNAWNSYNANMALAVELGDNGTRDLFQKLLADEEHHIDWLETQLELIDRIGEANYLAQYLHED
jgi:bacterioferritin